MAHRNPTRKHVIKNAPTVKVKTFNVSEWAGRKHFHPCRDQDCRLVFPCFCETPEVNARSCELCVRGEVGTYMEWCLPQDCCYGQMEVVTDLQVWEWKHLAGPGPWFKCPTCWRCQSWAVR